jgi:hypothetical protein
MKRIFRVDFGNYGGELVIGKVSDEFVKYWKDKIINGQMNHPENSSKLVNHLRELEWGDENIDIESPKIKKGDHIPPWNEIDDFEHLWTPYADGGFTVTEVTGLTGDEKYTEGSGEEFEPYGCIYSREVYLDDFSPQKFSNESQEDIDKNYSPVLLVHTSEKGNFGCVFVETLNGDNFEPEKFSYGVCENNYSEFIDKCFYVKKSLEIDTDFSDSSSSSSGDHAMVGYLDTTYHKPKEYYTDEYLEKEKYWE